jgi:hypothetical protein
MYTLLTASIITLSVSGVSLREVSQPLGTGLEKNKFTYHATIELQFDSPAQTMEIWRSANKYRSERPTGSDNGTPNKLINVYNASEPHVVWAFGRQRLNSWPTSDSSEIAISNEVRRIGELEVRKRYRIPTETIVKANRTTPLLDGALRTAKEMGCQDWAIVGKLQVAGRQCVVRERVDRRDIVSTGRVAQSQEVTRATACIDEITGLVLRFVQRVEYSAKSPTPSHENRMSVTRISFPKSLSASLFELPKGCTVNVPEIFKSVKVPLGVTRVKAKGRHAGTGLAHR